jgi:predicted Zn-dependent protease
MSATSVMSAGVTGTSRTSSASSRAASAAPSGAVRLTRRGRLVVTLVLTAMIVAAFVVFGGASVATRDAGAPEQVRVVEVEQGQTLWGIASQASDDGDVREMVYRIRELNSLPDSTLVEGQELAIPLG